MAPLTSRDSRRRESSCRDRPKIASGVSRSTVRRLGEAGSIDVRWIVERRGYDRSAMHSPWLAFTPGVDPRVRARRLRQSWERLLAGRELNTEPPSGAGAELRGAIVDSWKRSLDTGLAPVELLAPLEADGAEMRDRWAEHPLGSPVQVLLDQLKEIASESRSLIVVLARRTSSAVLARAASELGRPKRLSAPKDVRTSRPGDTPPSGTWALRESL